MVLVLIATVWNIVRTEAMIREFKGTLNNVKESILHTNQARIASFFRDAPAVPIDSKGRTTRRDTKDIPVRGGRMTQLTHKRRADAGEPDNRRLPDDA